MTLLLLEALGAGLILIGIIWWTMFSGRKNGELPGSAASAQAPDSADTEHAPSAQNPDKNTR